MQGYHFTQRLRQALALAREESARLHHEYVGTEHILLGLLKEGEGVASTVLDNLKIKPDAIREKIDGVVKAGQSSAVTGPDLPYTSRAKKVLEFAMSEARELRHSYVGTEHLLLGLLREEKGIGAMALVSSGLTLENARAETISILGAGGSDGPSYKGVSAGMSTTGVPMVAYLRGRILLVVSAALAWFIGGMLIFAPVAFEAPMGIVLDDKTATIAQAQGAILVGLGFINWLMRRATDRGAVASIMYGNLVVQALSFAIVLRALVRGIIPMAGVGPLVVHAILAAAFAWQLRRIRRG